MMTLEELLNVDEPALPTLRGWIDEAASECVVLPPSNARGDVLTATQVTTRSVLGAVAYETGGILIDHSWLRIIGSGHELLNRTLTAWNSQRAEGCFLVADDAVGGFFAVDCGGIGNHVGTVCYWSPDRLDWEPLGVSYSDFLHWAITQDLTEFYGELRWPSWRADVASVETDECFAFYPYLWTQEGAVTTSTRRVIPIEEAFTSKTSLATQLLGAE